MSVMADSVASFERIDLGRGYYGLGDKLSLHIMQRAEACYEKARARRAAIQTGEELLSYAEEKRQQFIRRMGGIPYDSTLPLNPQITGVLEEPELRIENVIFESRPKVYVTANVYIPRKRKEPCGAVLFQMGHSDQGKSADQYQRVARAIASAGLIVMAMDPVGQGERVSYYEPKMGGNMVPASVDDHEYAGTQCALIGDNITRYFVADAMRAVDYLASRPEVDENKIGATGSSGGGTQTCHLMVCDPRIQAAAPATFVSTRKHCSYAGARQDAEQLRWGGTSDGFDHHEFALCFAPKPLLLLTVDTDFFIVEGADEVYEAGKRFWELLDAGEKLQMVRDESEHKYTDKLAMAAAEFFAESLNGEKRQADPAALKSVSASELWCTKEGRVSLAFSDAKFVFDENLEKFHTMEKPEQALKDFLLEKMNFERQEAPLRLKSYYAKYDCGLRAVPHLWFPQAHLPNTGLRFSAFDREPAETVICLWDRGTDNIEDHIYHIMRLCREGKNALVLDLTGMGKCMPNKRLKESGDKGVYGTLECMNKELMFLGDSLCALRLFELNYAVKMVKESFGEAVSIYAEGVSAALAWLYSQIDSGMEIEYARDIVPDYKTIVETKYYQNYNISNILLPEIAKYFSGDCNSKAVTSVDNAFKSPPCVMP